MRYPKRRQVAENAKRLSTGNCHTIESPKALRELAEKPKTQIHSFEKEQVTR